MTRGFHGKGRNSTAVQPAEELSHCQRWPLGGVQLRDKSTSDLCRIEVQLIEQKRIRRNYAHSVRSGGGFGEVLDIECHQYLAAGLNRRRENVAIFRMARQPGDKGLVPEDFRRGEGSLHVRNASFGTVAGYPRLSYQYFDQFTHYVGRPMRSKSPLLCYSQNCIDEGWHCRGHWCPRTLETRAVTE